MITVQLENLASCLPELECLFPAHHAELGLFKDKMPLKPQYAVYFEREAKGEFILPTAREDGALVGYWPTFVARGLHYGDTLTATMDILWVHPEHRKGGVGKMLLDFLKVELKRRGVKLWWVGSKNHKPIEWFFEANGFVAAERYYCQWIGE